MTWADVFTLLGGILLAFATAVSTILVTRRTHSGNIRTSEAQSLWQESQDIRREQREELAAAHQELAAAHQERTELSAKVEDLSNRLSNVEEAHRQCREDLAVLTTELRRWKR